MYLSDTARSIITGLGIDGDTFDKKSPTGIALGATAAEYARLQESAMDHLAGVGRRITEAIGAGRTMQFTFAEQSDVHQYDEAAAGLRALNGVLAACAVAYKQAHGLAAEADDEAEAD
ncbi:hypothetical protein [Saccharothrix sp. HUAS TT1]|uniref:hypothetical protein n=1 Tax=unclassified Saccharothrix TaxID=2593673 RepID=UPI00345BAE58